jgi:hypothetical protein
VCLGGASQVSASIFHPLAGAPPGDARLRGQVIWVGGFWITGRDVGYAGTRIQDPRVAHYWDSRHALTRAYRRTLQTDQDPWDVYLVYGPAARWSGPDPPRPDFWMQMLGVPQAPVFNAQEFAARVRGMLERTTSP